MNKGLNKKRKKKENLATRVCFRRDTLERSVLSKRRMSQRKLLVIDDLGKSDCN